MTGQFIVGCGLMIRPPPPRLDSNKHKGFRGFRFEERIGRSSARCIGCIRKWSSGLIFTAKDVVWVSFPFGRGLDQAVQKGHAWIS